MTTSPVPPLGRGDLVAVVATAFAARPAGVRTGIGRLRRMGYRVRVGEAVFERDGYLAGSDRRRGADLAAALADPEVRAVWFVRGGYGTARLLDAVPWPALRRAPKWLIGYSDLTALFNAAARRSVAGCVYGPVVTELADRRAWHGPSLRALIGGGGWTQSIRAGQVVTAGRVEGRLLGGNLSVLVHLLGTRRAPDWRGALLVLEEIGEESYRVDRMLTQLEQAGVLRAVGGVLLGGMLIPGRRRFPGDRGLDELIAERLAGLGVPLVRDLTIGHLPGKRSVPIGGRCRIDTVARRVEFGP